MDNIARKEDNGEDIGCHVFFSNQFLQTMGPLYQSPWKSQALWCILWGNSLSTGEKQWEGCGGCIRESQCLDSPSGCRYTNFGCAKWLILVGVWIVGPDNPDTDQESDKRDN